MSNSDIYNDMIQTRGRPYRSDQIAPQSHYREPIDHSPGRLAGNSRVWGDASPEVQSRVIDALIASSRQHGLTPRETAHVLAIARVESGFNPDAAAGTTSASGLGQFVDKTGRSYQLNNSNRFDLNAQSNALVEHFIDNRNLASRRGQGEEYIYKFHHDGPTMDFGGLGLSRREVVTYIERYEQFVRQQLGQEHTTPRPQPSGPHSSQPADTKRAVNPLADGVLKRGEGGEVVVQSQKQLNALGYTGLDSKPLDTSVAHFGPNTEHAVKEFQKAHGIEPANGQIGKATLAALAEAKQHPLLSETTHPNHALYAAIAKQLPPGTKPEAIANVTLQAMENGMSDPSKLGKVSVKDGDAFVMPAGSFGGNWIQVDLSAPTANLQQMSNHMASETKELQQQQHKQTTQSSEQIKSGAGDGLILIVQHVLAFLCPAVRGIFLLRNIE